MIVKNATIKDLEKALAVTNKKYDGNLIWNRDPVYLSKTRIAFTLRVKESSGIGARRSHSGRRMVSACWHAHGNFFDNLLEINPDCVIKTAHDTISDNSGNWKDTNIGSIMQPMMFSDACDCY